MSSNHIHKCKLCGFSGTGNYCSHCGQSLKTKRISLKELLRELFHSFTHIEKGFFYTLKHLIVAPGRMQLTYIEGKRNIHQKPFSMFLMCATLTALFRYWIFNAVTKYYHADIISEAKRGNQMVVPLFLLEANRDFRHPIARLPHTAAEECPEPRPGQPRPVPEPSP